ncbi:dTDP-4-dehydrorhamnose reductase [Methanobrevibacter olleyae]|uniref:dTDP-4-dehydrorhamnose reductase n=1 Tax=Methanobrevibacter olleyae TaxID=294671 RepID=A0A126R2A1_METOL|nr:dTDP-4-dehydrorhamnose reductase [Methanobrevibacter olleyae]AMK16119.1 dTDP-4-dehydrorhamnose reductase RfbD [Methanobrevibacter olleyae]SFL32624.1 dTDP-4-dehydrorhamnose reductase [Methanobrevibacter olleyae]
MKILITGAYGMLGSDLREILKNHELIATGFKELDITNEEKVIEFICENSPEIVINAAAYTAVDDCETNYDDAYAVNAIGPRNLAIACNKIDIPLIHISTDYVFDGSKNTPLLEDDELGPQSAYGKTKLEGEKFIQENTEKYFILRTAWLYGVHGGNFVQTMLNLAKEHDKITVVNDQIGSPTFSYDLAKGISNLLNSEKYGIYHLTNEGECSWYEFAKDIFELSKIDLKLIPVSTEEFPRPAPRPHYSVLSNEKWIKAGFPPMRNYKEALNEYLALLNFMKAFGKI